MDYKIGFYFIGFIVIIILKLCHSQSERDVILIPKLALHVNGKTLYYKPSTILINQKNLTNNTPWEQTLKHVTFLTLSNDLNETSNLNTFPNYERFMNSTYTQNNIYIPKFGDIITLARGRLEINDKNEFEFIEGDCENEENCNTNKIIASWQVQKIRHRDTDKKFRYEIKFIVTPKNTNLNNEKIDSGKRDINNHRRALRSFVLKDTDYPKSFEKVEEHIAQRRQDENRQIYLEKLNSFNDIFSQPRYFNQVYNEHKNLNIGEYMPESSTSNGQSRTSSVYPFLFQTPTTYRPHHYKFDKPYSNFLNNQHSSMHSYSAPIIPTRYHHLPANYERSMKRPSTVTTHLHHHYYTKSSQIKDHRGTLDLIEDPFTSIKPIPDSIEHFNYRTPNPIPNQIPIPQYFPKFQESINFHHDHNTPTVHQLQTPPESYNIIHNKNPQIINYQHNTPSTIQQQQTPAEPYYNVLKENPQILSYHKQKFELPPLKYETPIQTENQQHNTLTQTPIYYQQNTPRPLLTSSGPQLFYMQPIPISSQLPVFFYGNPSGNSNEQKTPEPRNKNHYSDPDPLYNDNENEKNQYNLNYQQDELINTENPNNQDSENDEQLSNKKENQNEENENAEDIDNYKPDSINAQLPPPDEGQDLRVPYVENIVIQNVPDDESSKTASSKRITQQSEKVVQKTTQKQESQKIIQSTTSSPIAESSSKRYTLPPIPEFSSKKFIPNLKKIRKYKAPTKATIEKTTKKSIADLPKVITTPTAEIATIENLTNLINNNNNNITTTTTKLARLTTERPVLKWKPRTIKNKQVTRPPLKALTQIEFERIPVTEPEKVFTVTPRKLDRTIPTKQSVATSISYKIGANGIERPVVIPNLDIMEAKLVKLNTSDKSIKLFKAISMEDENETEISEKIQRELEESIVEHVKSL